VIELVIYSFLLWHVNILPEISESRFQLQNIQPSQVVDSKMPRFSHVLSHVAGALLLIPFEVIPKVLLNVLSILFQPFNIFPMHSYIIVVLPKIPFKCISSRFN
jgi:hypothetical protein